MSDSKWQLGSSSSVPPPQPPHFGLSREEFAEVFNENYTQLRKLAMEGIKDNPAHQEKTAVANTIALVGSIYELFMKNNEAVHRQVTEYVDKRLADAKQTP